MKKGIFITILALLIFAIGYSLPVYARSGCCSWHGGVCTEKCSDGNIGHLCCDGTPLSAKCAPYYSQCKYVPPPTPPPTPPPPDPRDVDNDKDGYTENQGDCDDTNANVNPKAIEMCEDGLDNDCKNGDELCPENRDDDKDGYTENEGDCNDSNADINPKAEEVCDDGIDNDCKDGDKVCPPANTEPESKPIDTTLDEEGEVKGVTAEARKGISGGWYALAVIVGLGALIFIATKSRKKSPKTK